MLFGYALLRECLDYKVDKQDIRTWELQVWQLDIAGMAISNFLAYTGEMDSWLLDKGST